MLQEKLDGLLELVFPEELLPTVKILARGTRTEEIFNVFLDLFHFFLKLLGVHATLPRRYFEMGCRSATTVFPGQNPILK